MKLRVLLIAAAALLLSAGCGKNKNQETQVPWIEDEKETERYLELSYFLPSSTKNETYPRLAFSTDDWRGAEIAYDSFGTDKVDYFYFVNSRTNRRYLVSVTDKSLCIAQGSDYDIFDAQNLNAVVATIDGNKLRCAEMHIWGGNSGYETGYDIQKISEMPWDGTKSIRDVLTKGATEDMVRQTFYDMFDWIGEKISKLGDYVSGAASEVCTIWTEVVVPVAQLNLYADDPDKLKEIMEMKKGEKIKGWVISAIGADDLMEAKDKFAEIWSQYGISDSAIKEQAYNILNKIKGTGTWLSGFAKELIGMKLNFQIDLNVGNVTETSASITGSVNNVDQIAQVYLRIREKSGNVIYTNYPSAPFPFNYTVEGLIPGTTYQASLEVYDYNYSTPVFASVEFQTPNYFQLDPASLHVEGKGDEYAIFVTVPGEGWEWEIISQPPWCYLSGRGNSVFKIKIAATPTARTGEIVVEAKNATESRKATVSITQDGLNSTPGNPDPYNPGGQGGVSGSWDGYTWKCVSASLTATGNASVVGYTSETLLNFAFTCINAATGQVDSNLPWNSIRLVNGCLEFHYSGTMIEGFNESANITVNPPVNGQCTGTFYYSGNGTYGGQSVNCTVSGPLTFQQM